MSDQYINVLITVNGFFRNTSFEVRFSKAKETYFFLQFYDSYIESIYSESSLKNTRLYVREENNNTLVKTKFFPAITS